MKEITIEDVLKKNYELIFGTQKYEHSNLFHTYSDVIKAAMTEYASLNRQGWTRVEDGEKETFKQILLTDGANYSIGFFGSDGLTDWEVNKYFNSRPTHWMPLPNKPSI